MSVCRFERISACMGAESVPNQERTREAFLRVEKRVFHDGGMLGWFG
jgi:hypothetical protein